MLSILFLPFKLLWWLLCLLFGLLFAAGWVVIAIVVVCLVLAVLGGLGSKWTYSIFPEKDK
jgi:hypothetical protein